MSAWTFDCDPCPGADDGSGWSLAVVAAGMAELASWAASEALW